MSVKASEILRIARGEVGVTEYPAGSNKNPYGKRYGWDGVAWCAQFVWAVFDMAGAADMIKKTASCTDLMSWAKGQGRWVTGGFLPGDVVLFDFDGVKSDADHTGFVVSWDGKKLVSIEGNTSKTSDDNGGAVLLRDDHGPYILGAFRPDYAPEAVELGDIIKAMTDADAYEVFRKAMAHAAKLGLPTTWNAAGELQEAKDAGITDGSRPMAAATRLEVAVMVKRATKGG